MVLVLVTVLDGIAVKAGGSSGRVGGGLNVLDVEGERWIQTQRNNKTKQKE